jgi:ureidoglycolate hydrolase
MAATHVTEVALEGLSAEGFAPFGAVLEEGWPASTFEGLPYQMLNVGFEVDGTPALYVIRYMRREMVLSKFERHLTMTETRISLGTHYVIVVAGATPIADRHRLPEPGSARAFLMRPGQGVLLKQGTWHALNCFPVARPFADFAFISEKEAEEELVNILDPDRLERTHIVDVASADRELRVVDPGDLMSQIVQDGP